MGDHFDSLLFLGLDGGSGPSENIEYGEFLFREALGDRSLVLFT